MWIIFAKSFYSIFKVPRIKRKLIHSLEMGSSWQWESSRCSMKNLHHEIIICYVMNVTYIHSKAKLFTFLEIIFIFRGCCCKWLLMFDLYCILVCKRFNAGEKLNFYAYFPYHRKHINIIPSLMWRAGWLWLWKSERSYQSHLFCIGHIYLSNNFSGTVVMRTLMMVMFESH